jgi:hypothetical protein
MSVGYNESRGCPVIVDVESNKNCEASAFARFKEAGPARPVLQVCLYDRNPAGEWYWVTGWSDDAQTPACVAYALRFKPINIEEPWSLESPLQWGEAYLSLASNRDLRYDD